MPADDFVSLERPGQRIKVDPVGRLAVPIAEALARGNRIAADALYRDLPALHREVLALVNRYFVYEPPDVPRAKTTRKKA